MKFVEAKKRRNYNDPVLVAMRQATPRAADGYAQDYGTAVLPGAVGTKWGWSDDRRSVHASVTYGRDFTVSANTWGTKHALTNDVRGAFRGTMGAPALRRRANHSPRCSRPRRTGPMTWNKRLSTPQARRSTSGPSGMPGGLDRGSCGCPNTAPTLASPTPAPHRLSPASALGPHQPPPPEGHFH